jgi:hypothetical protein
MRQRRWLTGSWIGAAVVALVLGVFGGSVIAQTTLLTGGTASNFGRHALRGQFMPDPFTAPITSGGNLDASSMSLGPACRGFVTREPDYIIDYQAPASFVRFYFVAQGDTTLVINDGAGRWHCNDDSYNGVNPTVDISRPASGQYDVWVGSYRAGENIRGTLHVTELRSRHP